MMAKKAPRILVVDPPALTIPPVCPDWPEGWETQVYMPPAFTIPPAHLSERETQVYMDVLNDSSVECVDNGDGTTTWTFRPKGAPQ